MSTTCPIILKQPLLILWQTFPVPLLRIWKSVVHMLSLKTEFKIFWFLYSACFIPGNFLAFEQLLTNLVEGALWGVVALVYISQIPQNPYLKDKVSLFKKIFYSLTIIYTIIIVLEIWIPGISPDFLLFWNRILVWTLELPYTLSQIVSSLFSLRLLGCFWLISLEKGFRVYWRRRAYKIKDWEILGANGIALKQWWTVIISASMTSIC